MSRTAMDYVKGLPCRPEGVFIKGTQCAVLRVLADYHNEKTGCAWPSIKAVARQCGISERYCRALMSSLEGIKIINRHRTRNLKNGGECSNLFTFPALGELTQKQLESFNQIAGVPRSLMRKRPRIGHPAPTDRNDEGRRIDATERPGCPAPPNELLGESLSEKLKESLGDHSAQPEHQASLGDERTTKRENQKPPNRTQDQCCDLHLGQSALDRAVDNLRQSLFPESGLDRSTPFVSGAKEWKSFRFEKLVVLSVERRDPRALLMTVKGPNPKSTTRGFKLHKTHLEEPLGKFYGVPVILKLVTGR